jgi:hypothetical protein
MESYEASPVHLDFSIALALCIQFILYVISGLPFPFFSFLYVLL